MFLSTKTGRFAGGKQITLGARTDSYYEYLLKQWIQTGKTHQWSVSCIHIGVLTLDRLLDDYLTAMNSVHSKLLRYSEPHKYAFVGEIDLRGGFYPKMVC
jgi:mannosyl-oligosaccharide alpha-1,2-mannosidase